MAIEILNQVPENKDQLKKWVEIATNDVLNGYHDLLKVESNLKYMEEAIKGLRSNIKDHVLEEAEKEGKNFDRHNCRFEIREVGVKYDYSLCDDQEWNDLDEEINKLSDLKRKRESLLKSLNDNSNVFGGDGVKLNPPAKKSTTSLITKIK